MVALGVRVPGFTGLGFQASSFGFRVSGFEFRVSSFGFRVSGFEFRVSSFEFQVLEIACGRPRSTPHCPPTPTGTSCMESNLVRALINLVRALINLFRALI